MHHASTHTPAILIIGASRGLGHAMAAEFLKKEWHVVGTVRAGSGRTRLHELADAHPDRVEIETLDITRRDEIRALHDRLAGRLFDILFVNAGTTNPDPGQTIGDVSTEDFVNLMITNALSPMRVVETLADLVPPTGLIGIMSSGQGSIEPVHAQLCRTASPIVTGHGADGTGLGAHRIGRARWALIDRRKCSRRRECAEYRCRHTAGRDHIPQ